jgi:hypothetical protein
MNKKIRTVCTNSRRDCHVDTYVLLALWLDTDKRPADSDTFWPYYCSWYPATLLDHQSRWHNTPHHFDTTQQPCEDVSITSIISHTERSSRTEYLYHSSTLHKYMAPANSHHPERCRFRAVLPYATHSL